MCHAIACRNSYLPAVCGRIVAVLPQVSDLRRY
jgi:hypothetical protein